MVVRIALPPPPCVPGPVPISSFASAATDGARFFLVGGSVSAVSSVSLQILVRRPATQAKNTCTGESIRV
jgi:hypothetical protein